MLPVNDSGAQQHPAFFLLVGIPGLEWAQAWIAIPLCTMYVIAALGNSIILYVIKTEPRLQEPMYLFLAMLAITDLVLSTSTVPKMLAVFWLSAGAIDFHACLAQMFFIHAFSSVESGVLMAMALDRYVAICYPLQHSAILSLQAIGTLGSLVLLRAVLLISPFAFLANRLPYCGHQFISHSYCEHMAVVKLACGNIRANVVYGLFVAFVVVGFDIFIIAMSYVMILKTVLRLPSQEARLKAFGTCASHICVILSFYIPALFTFLTHRFGHNVPHHIHIIVAILYLLVPPTLNPVIYGVKTKMIRERILTIFLISGGQRTTFREGT
uniref:olfactory receptor 52R1-like n=1 Tax=Podarcis muralis TaxID=64176 RepID=UPI00109F285C|nr:olfactory receptor 52R1-like [Podarcis muralis]XP_028581486.1 olfactory receptor 52R1-like [Podarcis muralis]